MDEDRENKIEVRHEPTLIEVHEPAIANSHEAPVAAPVSPTQSPVVEKQHVNTPGSIILQWLSYAFWGWLILGLIWLVGIIAVNAIMGEAVENVVPYAMAATIVLLPIAFVTDLFYRKHEPAKKTGAATVIMVIHVVLYALLGIGTLIAMVFTLLSMVIGSSDSQDSQIVALWVLGAATVFYALTFLRVLNPFKSKRFAMIFSFGMLVVTLGLLVWGVVGPVVTTVSLKDDRRIESHLSDVNDAVNSYISQNQKLPDSLSDVRIASGDGKTLVDDGLVRYEKVGIVKSEISQNGQDEYRYKLCVTYDHADDSLSDSYRQSRDKYSDYSDGYNYYVETYGHPAGNVCYKLQQAIGADLPVSALNQEQ